MIITRSSICIDIADQLINQISINAPNFAIFHVCHVIHGHSDLPEVVRRLGAYRSLANLLNGRQQQTDHQSQYSNDDNQL